MFKVLRPSIALFGLVLSICCVSQANAQIAPGETQSAAHTATVTGSVTSATGAVVPNANVTLTGPAVLSTRTDEHGLFVFTGVTWGVYQLSVTSSLGAATKTNVNVNGDISVAVSYQEESNLRTIARVSTVSQGLSINVTPASITSISPSDYAFQGNTSWHQLLNSIPGVAVGGGQRNGISCGAAIAGGPFQPSVLSINGAAPYETSVTLDGMPMQNVSPNNDLFYPSGGGAGTDVSFLPLATFDTADIVRGPGADAPSIVDSIGGAFVLHAPGAVSGNHFEYSIGNDLYGGLNTNAKLSLKLGKLSALITYGVNNSPGPLGANAQIPFSGYGWPVTINGNPTFGGGVFVGQGYTINNHGYYYTDSAIYCCLPYSTAWTSHSGALALSYAVTPKLTAQIFYSGSSTQSNEPDASYINFFQPGAGYTVGGSYAPGQYNFISPTEEGPINKGESLLEEKVTDYIGKGVLRLEALQNNSYFQISFPALIPNGNYKVFGTIQNAAGVPIVYNGTPAALTFYPCGPAADTYWVNNRDLLGSYSMQFGDKTNATIGYVTSFYNAPYEETFLVGGTPYPEAGRNNSVSSSSQEFHVAASEQFTDNLTVNASWYFSRANYHVLSPTTPGQYNDANYPYNSPRLSAVWRPSRNEAVRFAVGGGYALPALTSLIGTNSVSLPCTQTCSESITNINLQPEKSFGYDLGTDIRLHSRGDATTLLSIDGYLTNLYGQFYSKNVYSGTLYAGLPLYYTETENIAQSRFEGINLTIKHDVPHGVYWSAAVGLTRAYIVSVPGDFYNGYLPYTSVACNYCVNTQIVPGINFNGAGSYSASVSPVPYTNGTITLGYRWSPNRFIDLSPTYYGNNNVYLQPAFLEWDAHAGIGLARNITLYATARNITGIHDEGLQVIQPTNVLPNIPNAVPSATQYPNVFPTTNFGVPYGPRTVIVTLNYKM